MRQTKGSVGNVMKAGLRKYKEMIEYKLDTDQKVLAIQKSGRSHSPRTAHAGKNWSSFLLSHLWHPDGIAWNGNRDDPFILCLEIVAVVKQLKNFLRVFLKPCIIQPLVSVLQPLPSSCIMYLQPGLTGSLTVSTADSL
jgi:hypothetical protein